MRIIDLHCYPNTEPWIRCQGPYVEALAKYWNRTWTWKQEDEVVKEFTDAGVEAEQPSVTHGDVAQELRPPAGRLGIERRDGTALARVESGSRWFTTCNNTTDRRS